MGVIRATSSDSSYLRLVGRRTMPPSPSRASATQSPSLRLACLAIASGIRTARLFPHFETVVSFCICIYFEYTRDTRAIQPRRLRLHLGGVHDQRGPGLLDFVAGGGIEPELDFAPVVCTLFVCVSKAPGNRSLTFAARTQRQPSQVARQRDCGRDPERLGVPVQVE